MSWMSLSDFEYAGKRKQTRRECFLAETNQVVPWIDLVVLIELCYSKVGMGRRPYLRRPATGQAPACNQHRFRPRLLAAIPPRKPGLNTSESAMVRTDLQSVTADRDYLRLKWGGFIREARPTASSPETQPLVSDPTYC